MLLAYKLHNAVDYTQWRQLVLHLRVYYRVYTYNVGRLISLEKMSAGRNTISFEDKSLRKNNDIVSFN